MTGHAPATADPLRLAVIPGDGIGQEVTAEALKVLEAVAPVKVEPTRYDLGAERYLATGEVLPDSVLAEIREHDAILLGAVGGRPGDPNLPPGLLERGLLLRLRFELDHYVNLRPRGSSPGVAVAAGRPGRGRLRGGPGGHRGAVHRQRRRAAGGDAGRGRDRGVGQHGVRRRAGGARRVRPGAPPARPADPGPQDQRAGPRRRGVVADRRRGGSRVPRRHGRLPAHRRGHHLHDHRPVALRRDRHRQPVRRHHHRPGRRGDRRHRAGRVGQHQPRPDRAVDVRAGARLRARHRRPAEGRPHRGDPLRRDAARPPRARRRRRSPWSAPSWPTWPPGHPVPPGVPPRSATPSRPLV